MLDEIANLTGADETIAAAFVVGRFGSLPMSRSARLIVRAGGSISGTIGGGCLEARVIGAAMGIIDQGFPAVIEISLTEEEAAKDGLVCGGRARIFIEPVRPGSNEANVYRAAADTVRSGGAGLIATLVPVAEEHSAGVGWKCLIVDGKVAAGEIAGLDPASIVEPIGDDFPDRPFTVKCPDPSKPDREMEMHFEPVGPPETLYIFGAGHVAQPLARIASMIGFDLTVIDDREEFASRDRFPNADRVLVIPFEKALDELTIDERSYMVLVTRGHEYDQLLAAAALKTPARYIGMIGSRRKVAVVRKNLLASGLTEKEIDRLHSPIGIEIGSDTPEEIAVSIAAELIRVRRLGE
jgi:xanthine dehydrogenase accessory factor